MVERIIKRQTRYDVIKRQGWKCNSCAAILRFNCNSEWNGEVAHIDHIYPYAKRKSYPNGEENINEISNLQALCPKCNLIKLKSMN